jgi:hypothetical protein
MFRDGLAARLRRAKIVAALRSLEAHEPGSRARRALEALRRRPDAVIAFVLGVCVVAMILHWR